MDDSFQIAFSLTYLKTVDVPHFPKRANDSHKGDYGRVLLVGGSVGMSGAIVLAGRAAMRTGTGLMKIAVPKSIWPIVAGQVVEGMALPMPETRSGKFCLSAFESLMRLADEVDVVAIGPGLGRSAGLDALVSRFNREVKKPMVIDADALNALASRNGKALADDFATLAENGVPRILTPHPGELSRLIACFKNPVSQEKERTAGDTLPHDTPGRIKIAQEWVAAVTGCQKAGRREKDLQRRQSHLPHLLVFKGAETVVTDGEQTHVNPSGNPGMATGGSGDVLTGIIASLLGQRFTPFDAGKLGVFLHGLCGDIAVHGSGIPQESVIASTLINHIDQAILLWSKTGITNP
ncbi:MAG: NAD(P)H-hydrate dehydratase [Planctomycetaceae bacterium]|nr:NAD(P)H-hydrate dehydratase [Planctomycetaceae bacterium]